MRERRIVWLAIIWSTFILAGMVWYTTRGVPIGSFDDAVKQPLVLLLYGLGLVDFMIGLFGFGLLKERDPKKAMVIRLALFESVAIYGVVAAFISRDWRLYLPMWAVALIGMIREWPSETE